MPILATDAQPTDDPDRLVNERACRAEIKRIFAAVLEDKWTLAYSIYRESRESGEWFHVAVWAGLPNTVRERLREMERG